MPDIYSTTQLFTCYDKYAENLIDLSKYDFTGKYNEARISQYELEGKIYLLPTDYDVFGLLYNDSMFKREGWDVPASFEELEKLAPVIKEAGYDLADCATQIAMVQLEEVGIQVTRASDGREAVKFFAENPPGTFDMILMDVMMPEMNGHIAKPINIDEVIKAITRNIKR